MFTQNWNKPWLPVANTEPGIVLVFCEYMEDPIYLNFIEYFWLKFHLNIFFGFLVTLRTSAAEVPKKERKEKK